MDQDSSSIPVNRYLDLKIVRATLLSRPPLRKGDKAVLEDEKHDHLLAFSLSIRNEGNQAIRLTGKKWIVEHADKTFDVFESSQVFNARPLLLPDQIFAYNGYHVVLPPAGLHLTLLGKDETGSLFRSKTIVIHPPEKKKPKRKK